MDEIGTMQVIEQDKKRYGYRKQLPAKEDNRTMQVIKQVKKDCAYGNVYLQWMKLAPCR